MNDQINGIVQDPFYKVETMGDYQIPMRVLDAYNDLYVATLATTEYIYYLHDSDDVLMVGLENRQKEINKILDTSGNENSKVVVEDDLEEERNESCMEL